MAKTKPSSIDEYIAGFPQHTQQMLQLVRRLVHEIAPGNKETISYSMPAFEMNDTYLVYMSGYKNHISIYPSPGGDTELDHEMAPYRSGKGTLQFALSKPLPEDLIKKVIVRLVAENAGRKK